MFDLEPVSPTMAAALPHAGLSGGRSSPGKTEPSLLAGDWHGLTVFVSMQLLARGREVPKLRKLETTVRMQSRSLRKGKPTMNVAVQRERGWVAAQPESLAPT